MGDDRAPASSDEGPRRDGRARALRIARHVLYWAAVLAISLALVVALILWLESRDPGAVGALGAPRG